MYWILFFLLVSIFFVLVTFFIFKVFGVDSFLNYFKIIEIRKDLILFFGLVP